VGETTRIQARRLKRRIRDLWMDIIGILGSWQSYF
jgi:hypothetical protein